MSTVMPTQTVASGPQTTQRGDIRQARQFGAASSEPPAGFHLAKGTRRSDAAPSGETPAILPEADMEANAVNLNISLPDTNPSQDEDTGRSQDEIKDEQDLSELVQQLFTSMGVAVQTAGESTPEGSKTTSENTPYVRSSTDTSATQTATLRTLMMSITSPEKEMSAAKATSLTSEGMASVTQVTLPNASPLSSGATSAVPGITSNPATTHTVGAEWASVRIDTQAGKWGEQMLQVLQDRVTLQAQQNLQEARIRLDPPDLGKLDLMVRVEGDRLSVQIHANSAATREALMQVSDRLRAELQNQNFVHVDVNVGSERGDQSPQQSSQQDSHTTIFSARDNEPVAADMALSEHWLNTRA